jgi:malonyl-CoA/methylmalonyl-CoA synthetase
LLTTPDGTTYTYADALDESGRVARCLSDLGLKAGDRVTVQVEKSPMVVWLYLGCLRGGFVFHPLNMDYQAEELEYFIGNAKPAAIVCDPAKLDIHTRLAAETDCRVLTLAANDAGTLVTAMREMPPDFQTRERKLSDIAVLLYSSGTTGPPKGAKITHANLAANATTLVRAWGFTAADTLLHTLPVYHAHGLFVGLGCVLMSGASMQFLPRFSAAAVCTALPVSTVMMGVPTYYSRLLSEAGFDAALCAHMRLFICGSAPLPETLLQAFHERSGHLILERYGMTETGMNASNPLTGERRPGTVGPALPGVELRVTDEADQPLPAGTVGHLQVRGPNVFAGYWRTGNAARNDFTADGFFRTGDLAAIAADGYVTIAGRSRDLIITGGLNVYPRELENVLDSLPEVVESAVIGVPHDDFGEAVVAVVVASGGRAALRTEELLDTLRPRLAGYKLPKQVVVVDALPRNSMGKVQKNRLREQYAGLFSTPPA